MSRPPDNPYVAPTGADADGRPVAAPVVSPTFVAALVSIFVLLVAMVITRGRFIDVFADFEAELPAATHIAISPWALVVVAVLLATTFAKEFAGGKRTFVRIWNGLACLVALVLGIVYTTALFLPLLSLVEDLS